MYGFCYNCCFFFGWCFFLLSIWVGRTLIAVVRSFVVHVFFSIHVLFAINFFAVTVSLVLFCCYSFASTFRWLFSDTLMFSFGESARLRYVCLNKLLKVYYVLLLSLVFYCFPLFHCLRSASSCRHRHCRRCRWFFLKFTFANQSWFLIDFNGFPHAPFVATTTTNLTIFFPSYFLVVFHCDTINK